MRRMTIQMAGGSKLELESEKMAEGDGGDEDNGGDTHDNQQRN